MSNLLDLRNNEYEQLNSEFLKYNIKGING